MPSATTSTSRAGGGVAFLDGLLQLGERMRCAARARGEDTSSLDERLSALREDRDRRRDDAPVPDSTRDVP
jgi:hypothetical protein